MKIRSISIINNYSSLDEIATLYTNDEILEVFKLYNGISTDNTFVFKDSIYVTEEIAMNLVNNEFEVQVYVKFLQLVADV
ncbi:hypothetical protein DRF65_08960 [Chryseobacterium pennae]|uniref:Uncharacterized protein n=1 Tax=Chryseobacterium pennae TaxID=2258962 RepID=A0A3D9CAP7_9FLAO|nr:hypothetical protein [Chryseobacterium pennae]REC62935.1 hypothetical protein DRF65_08960 [Chryseobacterium pennae]